MMRTEAAETEFIRPHLPTAHDSLLGVRSAGEMGLLAHARHGPRRSRITKETLVK